MRRTNKSVAIALFAIAAVPAAFAQSAANVPAPSTTSPAVRIAIDPVTKQIRPVEADEARELSTGAEQRARAAPVSRRRHWHASDNAGVPGPRQYDQYLARRVVRLADARECQGRRVDRNDVCRRGRARPSSRQGGPNNVRPCSREEPDSGQDQGEHR